MCQQTTDRPTAPKSAPPAGNTCRWITTNSAALIRSGQSARLSITVDRKVKGGGYRPETVEYSVCWLGAEQAWLLTHDIEGSGSGECFVDYRVSWDYFSCDCPAANYNLKEPCKHARALFAALPKIGIQMGELRTKGCA